MTIPASADVTIVDASANRAEPAHYVDWAAIIAGVLVASGISLLLLTFGSAVGLSFTNFRSGPEAAPLWVAIAGGLWLLWVQISSFMAGGYLTGRMRRRAHDATSHEVDVRDGAHGLLVWATALVFGAFLAATGIGNIANTIGSVASTATQAASNVADDAAESFDPNAYFVDAMFRAPAADTAAAPAATPTTPAPAAGATPADSTAVAPQTTTATPVAATAPVTPAGADTSAARDEAGRILLYGALEGEIAADDRTYLAQLVASNTELTQEEAAARVDQVMADVEAAKAQAAEAAETARKASVLAAFLVAASLLVSAVGAYWAASMGGRHRDEGTVFEDVFRRY